MGRDETSIQRTKVRAPLKGGIHAFFWVAGVFFSIGASAQILPREPAAGTLSEGHRVYVDDGTCPSGQVDEVMGGSNTGKSRVRRCVARDQIDVGPAKMPDAQWVASVSLIGDQNNCGWREGERVDVSVKAGVLLARFSSGSTWTLSGFNRDGSARLKGHLARNHADVLYEVAPGLGAREIREIVDGGLCVWVLTPR